ncbi:MAG: DUF2867 domain-containing protein [Thermoplasmata archaeon]|nr:SDR family oxidoreductase [Thermoplasmata archaeon]NIS13268.1 SDR family oxidoreductase [Thermoplasmata archaeon]NIS21163.1 SDR family oxidoreductase [Thermoplasmata archaeon]NIT78650.1 SDR family oxidoreductase [Thermoplasmata archaeon]NIU50218.1 SDR family oxidoreductase [Thermoplasmata archaeon]
MGEGGSEVLVLGASGYVGSRLVALLVTKGHRVRAASRSAERMEVMPWADHPSVDMVEADVLDGPSLERACEGADVVYYLVHSMVSSPRRFAQVDREGAENLARAAAKAEVGRIIYLGGLSEVVGYGSEHLKSRDEVAQILDDGEVPTTTLRAAMVMGSGSASFEIMRYLVDRLPMMTTPKWVQSLTQPIAIRDVLGYLAGVLEVPETVGRTFDVGGPEVLNYMALMDIYTEEAGMRRRIIIQVPFLSPKLSSYWIGLVTPVPAAMARRLAEGLSSRSVCKDRSILELVPMDLQDSVDAIRGALDPEQWLLPYGYWDVETMARHPEWAHPGDPPWAGGTEFEDRRRIELEADGATTWEPVERIGEELSCCYPDRLWNLWRRGDRLACDLAGRLDLGPREGRAACALWDVHSKEKGSGLTVRLDLGPFGAGSIGFGVDGKEDGPTRVEQRVSFRPKGVAGIVYWYATLPVHLLVFDRTIRWVAKETGGGVISGPRREVSLRAGASL